MSQIHNGIFGALALSLTLGAVQFASGHDLAAGLRQAALSGTTVNRAAKADRATVKAAPAQTQTIALRSDSIPGTSVLVRVPDPKDEARNRPSQPDPSPPKSPGRKMAVACEPPVSVLTEVAKLLQPGRCVT